MNFNLEENNTSTKQEFVGGLTSFLATFYIIIVNPVILSKAGMPFDAVATATIIVAAFSTILMGLYANNPIVLAPGMGLNAFFTFSVVLGMQIPWQTALGIVFWSGVIFLILSVLNLRTYILKAIPAQIRLAISAGIGLFIAFIGLQNGGIIVDNPATLVSIAKLSPITATFFVGLIITSVLVIRRVTGALVFGMVATLLLAYPIGRLYGDASAINHGMATLVNWRGLFAAPNFSLFGEVDFAGSFKLSLFPVLFAFMFTDLFDSISTFLRPIR